MFDFYCVYGVCFYGGMGGCLKTVSFYGGGGSLLVRPAYMCGFINGCN